jgi:hypothetical protein
MTDFQVSRKDLPVIYEELRVKAELFCNRLTKNVSSDKVKHTLEGIYIQIQNLSIAISKQAG